MAERVFDVEWECLSCSHPHKFRRVLGELDDWPNKFEDLKCQNPDCGHIQDVRFQHCTVSEVR